MDRLIRTIHDIRIGDSVASLTDNLPGTVADVDGAIVTVQWINGDWSHYHKRDGFTLFTVR